VTTKPATKATIPAAKPTGTLKGFLNKQTAKTAAGSAVNPPDAPEAEAAEEGEETELVEEANEEVVEEGGEVEEQVEETAEEEAPEEPAPPPKTTKKKVIAKKPPVEQPAVEEEPDAAEELATGAQFVLYVDCVAIKGLEMGRQVQDVEELIGPSRDAVEADAQMNFRLIEYGKGADVVAAQLEEALKAEKPLGRFHASGRIVDRQVLEVLCRYADVVIKGGF
jgi:hypothetical protein